MNKTTQLLRVIQMFKLAINPVFFVPFELNKAGFLASKKRAVVTSLIVLGTYATKICLFTRYKLKTVDYYVVFYHLVLTMSMSALSYIGYIVNSDSMAKTLNNILSQSRPIADPIFCKKACVAVAVQLLVIFGIPFITNVWCNSNSFFFSEDVFWLFTVDIWLAFILEMHLTTTSITFSNALLLCRQNIAKVNEELVKMHRDDYRDSVEVDLLKIKDGWMSRTNLSEEGLASMMSMYDSVCQSCADLNVSYGCSVSCTYISSLSDIILVVFYIIKYGVNQLWVFIIINFFYFLNIWFILFACETFTKEMRKTSIIVNRLMLATENQREKELFQQFSIFLLHRKVKFTAWGLFNLDYKMIYSTLSMAITYLSLVHQFENSYSSSDREGTSSN